MNKKLYCYILFFYFPFSVLAQQTQNRNIASSLTSDQFYADSTKQQLFNFAKKSSYYLNDLMPERINKASLIYNFEKGHYIPSQGATKINSGKLVTEGTVKLGTVKLFGGFSYTKTFEDSTRYAHQTRDNNTTPYYFGSPAYVHYERSVYDFNAMASKNFLNERLNFSVGTTYKVGDHYSTNDPRGSIGQYQLNLEFALGYKIDEKFKLGLAYRTGYGQEKVNIAYKNQRYYESSSYPMYYNHLINGYGEDKPLLNNRRYNDNHSRNGIDIYLDLKTQEIGDFYISSGYLKENQRYFYNNDSGFTEYAGYELETTAINLLWNKTVNIGNFGLIVDFEHKDGKDFNVDFKANNYKYISEKLRAKLFLTQKNSNRIFNHYVSIAQNNEERVDGIKANDVYYNNLNLNAGSSIRINKKNNKYLGFGISVGYKTTLDDSFSVALANRKTIIQSCFVAHGYAKS